MPFTADELSNISNASLDNYIDKGKVWKQNVANKPMLKAFNDGAGTFAGGKGNVSFAVKAGQGGGTLSGYTHDDQVGYYNPTGIKRASFPWKEHHIGIVVSHTELKNDGIDVTEDESDTSDMSGREEQMLANIFDEKLDSLGEDYAYSLDSLVHGDGTSDTKALAGIQSLVLDNPAVGSTGSISRVANTWFTNRAATTAYTAVQGPITVNTASGGALIEFLEKEYLQLTRYQTGSTKWRMFCGSDFLAGYKKELRANGNYSMTGFMSEGVADGGMSEPAFKGIKMMYDPTLDRLGLTKRCYWLDMGSAGVRLLYMDGQRMKKHKPARPYDRYVMYNGITSTAVLIAKQLNTSGVYDIA
jgi:hypothetical protein